MIFRKKYSCNKTCKTCEFCYFDENKGYYVCTSGDTELGAGWNRIYDFKKIRSCWHIGYDEYIKQKEQKILQNERTYK